MTRTPRLPRRRFLAALALPALLSSPAGSAAPDALPPEWYRLASELALWFPEARAAEVRAAVTRAYAAGLRRSDYSGAYFGTDARPLPLTLCFGDWTAGTQVLVRASGVLRYCGE